MHWVSKTDLGTSRTQNEDYILALPEYSLWILADGVGGLAAGEIASKLASDVIAEQVLQGASLKDAAQTAHQKIQQAPEEGLGQPGMATTIVVIKLENCQYEIAWVGDSRAYLIDNIGQLKQLTKDHSLVAKLVEIQHITAEEARHHPAKNVVTQVLGQADLPLVEVGRLKGELHEKESILICSDGLSDYVAAEEIEKIYAAGSSLNDIASQLIVQAIKNKAKDNVSLILIQPDRKEEKLLPNETNVDQPLLDFFLPWKKITLAVFVTFLLLYWFEFKP